MDEVVDKKSHPKKHLKKTSPVQLIDLQSSNARRRSWNSSIAASYTAQSDREESGGHWPLVRFFFEKSASDKKNVILFQPPLTVQEISRI